MKLFVADAFTATRFAGNQAGVVLIGNGEDLPETTWMQKLAAELKHSETAFIKRISEKEFQICYFTPDGEVELCGHATIAAFTVLREEGIITPGIYQILTLAGKLEIEVSGNAVWMDMADPKELKIFSEEEAAELYRAYGLTADDGLAVMKPKIISTCLCDILLPVSGQEALERADQNESEVIRLSGKYGVVGVHLFWPSLKPGETAHCRNFAPLYAIPEEAATGTSNGALTYYLYQYGLIQTDVENRFIQGEYMGKPSEILSRLSFSEGVPKIRIGGQAVVTLSAELY